MVDDRKIIELFFKRSEEAVKSLCEKYSPYCFKIAWNILFNKEDSDECVNDTALKTWESIPPKNPDCLKAFVGRITRNLALNRYEENRAAKRGGGQCGLCLEELDECVSGGDNTEKLADSMALRDCLNSFLVTLKEEERKFFVKRYWYMMPVKEIAEEMACTESKVKMSLSRNREKLKVLLESEGFE